MGTRCASSCRILATLRSGMRHHRAEPMMSSLTLAHARTRPSCVMTTFSVATSLEPASKSAPVHFDGQPCSKFHRATSSILEFFATIEPLRRGGGGEHPDPLVRHSLHPVGLV